MQPLTQQDFDSHGALFFPQSFLTGVLENAHFCNPIQWGNFPVEWLAQPQPDGLRQPTHGTDTQARTTGAVQAEPPAVNPLVAADLNGWPEAEVEAHINW